MARTSKIGASEVFDCILHVARAFIKKPLHSRYGTAPLQRFAYSSIFITALKSARGFAILRIQYANRTLLRNLGCDISLFKRLVSTLVVSEIIDEPSYVEGKLIYTLRQPKRRCLHESTARNVKTLHYRQNGENHARTRHCRTVEHHIAWIALYYVADGSQLPVELAHVNFSAHGPDAFSQPVLKTTICVPKLGVISAVAYCNIHGLWQSNDK